MTSSIDGYSALSATPLADAPAAVLPVCCSRFGGRSPASADSRISNCAGTAEHQIAWITCLRGNCRKHSAAHLNRKVSMHVRAKRGQLTCGHTAHLSWSRESGHKHTPLALDLMLTLPCPAMTGLHLRVAGAEHADVARRDVREGEQARGPEHGTRPGRVLRCDHVLEQQQPDLLRVVSCAG